MKKLTKDEARIKLREAKEAMHNNAISFDRYVEIKRQCKKVFEE